MSDLELTVGGSPAEASAGWTLAWIDRGAGIARLSDGSRSELCIVEGEGSEWVVTLRGRRIPVTVRSWRDRMLAEAESAARQADGPVEVRATLPGLVVAVAVEEGAEVGEGAVLLTIEAMKMQNEVRAPRAGTVSSIFVAAGDKVVPGASLLRIE
jgi:acetyl/propionyl-CoA carboxylase alpha subunit